MSDLNPVELLLHLYDVQYNRYNSFKEKIGINIGLASGFVVIFSIIFPCIIESVIKFIFFSSSSKVFNIIHLLFIVVFCAFIIAFITIYIYILIKSSIALNPIKITTIDYESIDLYENGQHKLAHKTGIKDLKYSIEENTKSINILYSKLLALQEIFNFFVAIGVIILTCIIYISIFVKVVC